MRIFLIAIMLLMVPIYAVNYNVGVSPPVVDMGVVQSGTSNIVRFYVLTASVDPITVRLEESDGLIDFFTGNYAQQRYNFSEEPASGWVEFFSNPVELLPTESVGYDIKGAREINFLLNIPGDAEPGFHLINIRPTPITQNEGVGQVGAQIAAVTTINIIFYVDGGAERGGNVTGSSYTGGVIETYFKNTGSVTMKARAKHKAYGESTIEAFSSIDSVEPGELHKFSAPFAAGRGDYNVETTVDYGTGLAAGTSQITLAQSTAQPAVQQAAEFPWWIIIVILIIAISIVIYKRK